MRTVEGFGKMMGKEQYVRGMWEYFRRERDRVNKFREQAEAEKQAGIQGQWQLESPAKEYHRGKKIAKLMIFDLKLAFS